MWTRLVSSRFRRIRTLLSLMQRGHPSGSFRSPDLLFFYRDSVEGKEGHTFFVILPLGKWNTCLLSLSLSWSYDLVDQQHAVK